ncbi:hypothetical protein, partial [Spirosoma sp.]|uniref:hypothetical protein n=1 Tax=Spirosoma sp. TaxID=1899569 RepID=UPI003B3A8389
MMKTDLETIENYLTGQLSSEERTQFEATLRNDPDVANAMAFYLVTKQTALQEAREQRRQELDALRKQNVPARPLQSAPIRWVAAASLVLLLGLGWYFLFPTESTAVASHLADEYVTENFMQLPTTMDGMADSLKIGAEQFNLGKLAEADAVFQAILSRQPDNDSALKYAGIVSLRQGNYDKAITSFHQLSQQTDLVANPGTFYEAIALLKRGQKSDESKAKQLLEEVVSKNLEGKRE